jgi:hypothetical protein
MTRLTNEEVRAIEKESQVIISLANNNECIPSSPKRKGSSILERCRPSSIKQPKSNPNILSLDTTPKNKIFAAFPICEDVVVVTIKTTKGTFTSEKFYVVTDDLHASLADDKSLESISIYMIQLKTGETSLTYCKNGPLNGDPCTWFVSKKACLDESMEKWLSINTNHDEGIYESTLSDEQPVLPSNGHDFYETLEIALADCLIDSLDHPILVANNIGQPKRSSSKATTRRIRVSSQIKKS